MGCFFLNVRYIYIAVGTCICLQNSVVINISPKFDNFGQFFSLV